jgi:dsDNA-specific endonuclease/ATPase MutS2
LLGSSASGEWLYIEPPSAVPLNNELIAARGELLTAEEAVLLALTGQVCSER